MSGITLKSLKLVDSNKDVLPNSHQYYLPPPTPTTTNGGQVNQVYYIEEPELNETAFETKLGNKPTDLDNSKESAADADEQTASGCCVRKIQTTQTHIREFTTKNGSIIKRLLLAGLAIFYGVYFAFALSHRFGDEGSIRLLWVTCVVCVLMIYSLIKKYYGNRINENVLKPTTGAIRKRWKWLRWIVFPLIIIALLLFIILDIAVKRPDNLVSIVGIVVFITLFFIFSHNPSAVRWRPVLWGMALQFILGLIVLRTSWGRTAFEWLGSRVKEFLEHTNAGSKFVFGNKYEDHPFAMKVMPVVIFFSTVISVLYFLGVMQLVISKIAWLMQVTLGTTAAESMNAAGNIFVGQTEAPLLIKPLIHNMTDSELHAVLVGGFATIAGAVMATFISMGVPANHLLTASVMAAPAGLAMSKLSYPETKESKTTMEDVQKMERPPYRNAIEAASAGASQAIKLVANIAANLIAFIALLTFVNATLMWFGARVGIEPPKYPPLTFQLICSYVFVPISFVMGVALRDCRKVAELIGMKIFINEFVAYTELSNVINNTKTFDQYRRIFNSTGDELNNGNIYLPAINTTLVGGIMEPRSITISTYAMCGFANIGSIGIALGGLGAMAPERKSDLASYAVRAMITGATTSFLTACIAGLMYQGN